MKLLLIISPVILMFLIACAEIARFEDKSSEEIARGITDACDNPSAHGSEYVQKVNVHLADRKGDTLAVTCAPR